MDSDELDELLAGARQLGRIFREIYRDVTGDEPDLESAVRHYPLLALGAAAGAGVAAGWWFGRKSRRQLPPPAETPTSLPLSQSIEYLGETFPGAIERVREKLPEITVSDEVKARARAWVDTVLERELRQNVDSLADTMDARLSTFFRKAIERLGPEDDVQLDEPDERITPS
jgi:hypothetical protein